MSRARRSNSVSRQVSPEFLLLSFRSLVQEGAGKTGCRPRTRGPLREDVAQEEPHSSIQVVPITRPSLRSGLTAYAVLSREPNSFWPPSPRRLAMQFTRLGSLHLRGKLDRSDDGQDHTVLPYARFASSPQYFPALSTLPKNCWRDEPDSAARRRAVSGSQGLPALPAPLAPNAARVHRKPGSRSRRRTIAPQG